MPVGIQRLNAKRSQPNPHIVFIKPLPGPDAATAQDFLERIAAQCVPVMREHGLAVTSLEEFPPNREFVGRNFNAGEVIQLVLRAQRGGRWLPFPYVQMVMMHELAHCRQMNHSRAFWAVRHAYAAHMRGLWARGYTGEGLWGRGALLGSGTFADHASLVRPEDDLPEHLCGGTYQSSRKRKKTKKPQLSYQERKERRIRKKFGAGGVALGEDEDAKAQLEKGKKRRTLAKPRVAGSNRGRDLRAAAALARFDQQKVEEKEEEEEKKGPIEVIDIEDDDEEESDSDETASGDDQEDAAVDINGQRLLDRKGHRLVKVCEDENTEDDGDARDEMKELYSAMSNKEALGQESASDTTPKSKDPSHPGVTNQKPTAPTRKPPKAEMKRVPTPPSKTNPSTSAAPSGVCPMCSFDSGPDAAICSICSHVMNPRRVPGSWKCKGPTCVGSLYLNAGDSGVCGVCGERKTFSK